MSFVSILKHRVFGQFVHLFVSTALTALLSGTAAAQTTSATDGSTPLGLSPGAPAGSYSLSGFENVNLYNGNLNFHLPLVSIGGRGGAHTSSILELNNKYWTVTHRPIGTDGDVLDTPSPNWWTRNAGYGPGVLVGRQSGYGTSGCSSGRKYFQTLTRLTFTAGDGTEYEFRDQATAGQPTTLSDPCTASPPSRGTVFVSSDGSAATFFSDNTIYDQLGAGGLGLIYPSGYLRLRDGTRFRIDGGNVTWLRDRNGNKITFTYDSSNRVLTITDSLNRQVAFTYADINTFSDVITLKGFSGTTRTVSVNYSYLTSALRSTNPRSEPASRYQLQTYKGLFPELNNASSSTNYNPSVVSSITLPNNQQYQFSYNSYGELARVTLPTGGALEYDYTPGSGASSDGIFRGVIERRVYSDGSNLDSYTTFSGLSGGVVTVDQRSASDALLTRSKSYYYGDPVSSIIAATGISYPARLDGREYQTESYAADGTTLLRRSQTTWVNRAPVTWWSSPGDPTEPPNDPRASDITNTLTDVSPNLVSKQTFGYDDSVPYNNRNDVKEYDFGSGAAGSLLRETRTTYITSSSYTDASTGAHIRSLPCQISVYDPSGVERARTSFEYDNYATDTNHAGLIDRPSISGLDSSFSTSYTTRGNATGTTRYLLTNGSVTGSVSAYGQFDIAGNAVKAIDARGYATTFDYSDRFGSPDAEATSNTTPSELSSVGQSSYAFMTSASNALGHTAYSQFDYYTGKVVDAQDINGMVSSGYYNDSLDRPTQVVRAANLGTSVKSQTTFSYDDSNHAITTTSDQTTYNDNALVSKVFYDDLGRTIESRQYEGGTNYIAVKTQYDALGRAYKTSNPFRPWQSESAVWTTSVFDALGRVFSVTTPDNAAVTTNYSGNTVTASDQTSKARKSVTDALGRLTSVFEDPSGLNYQTSYTYDVLDSLTLVSQGSQTRTFVYDSLKRLTSATNPESGRVCYGRVDTNNVCQSDGYDPNGNLIYKTDARGVLTTYAYDALNRNTSVDYSNTTSNPDIQRYYDNTINYGKGRYWYDLYYQDDGTINHQAVDGYDALGRVWVNRQVFYSGGQWYGYESRQTFDLAGHVKSLQYPSGHTTNYNYDGAGRLGDNGSNLAFTGTLGDGTSRNYASAITYSSLGGMQEEMFGMTTPLYHKERYNIRGQLWDMRLSTVPYATDPTNGDRGAIVNYYSNSYTQGGSGTDNNGNVLRQENYIPGSSYFQDNFVYDSLNRLTSISEKLNGTGADSFKQAYIYDPFGNRTIDQTNTTSNLPKPNFGVDTTTNRLTAPTGYTMGYDPAGNLTADTYTGEGTRTYDAENRMTTAWANSQWQSYSYDADGHRARRKVNGTETWQVYGPNGELLAEYAPLTAALSPQKEYAYRNGQLLITAEKADTVWIEDSLPAGEWHCVCGVNEEWNWASSNPTPQSGTARDTTVVTSGLHQQFFQNATQILTVNTGDSLAAYVYLDGTNMPSELMLQFYEGRTGWEHRAYWGANNIDWGTDGTVSRHHMGALPVGNQWVRLEIPASQIGLEGTTLTGFALTLYDGKASLDHVGKTITGSALLHWLVTDQLGTPRMIFDQSDNVSRHDYLPFGEEVPGDFRSGVPSYATGDNLRQKFTGQERDHETGLDYMLARYHANAQGRFASPDSVGGTPYDPQSLNRYSYVVNSPLNFSDPTGHMPSAAPEFTPAPRSDGGAESLDDPSYNAESILSEFEAQAVARYESLRTTGYDPYFQRYDVDVTVRAKDNHGNIINQQTLPRPTLAQVEAVGDQFLHQLDELFLAARRNAALAELPNNPIASHIQKLQPYGEGYIFETKPGEIGDVKDILAGPQFKSSGFVLKEHRKAVGCKPGDCRDNRGLTGAFGPGSMQVVYDKKTGRGYFDVDRFNPYQNPPLGFFGHLGELLKIVEPPTRQ